MSELYMPKLDIDGRKSYQEVGRIMKDYNVDEVYSWSKISTFTRDTYEYMLNYILHTKQDRNDNIYGKSGGVIHSILEKFYSGQIPYSKMIVLYKEFVKKAKLDGYKYNRSNKSMNDKIANNYENAISHFLENHKPIYSEQMFLEKFVHGMIGHVPFNKVLFTGYVDMMYIDDDGNLHIIDWKSSSLFSEEEIEMNKWQLIIYAYLLHDMIGVPVNKMILEWCMLKYVEVDCMQKNGKVNTRIIDRSKIGESLGASVKMWLNTFEYDEDDIRKYLDEMLMTNNINHLPQDVLEKYDMRDYFLVVDFNKDDFIQLDKMVDNIIKDINDKNEQSKIKDIEEVYWQEVSDNYSYFMANLSGYSPKIHKPYSAYLQKRQEKEEELIIVDDTEDDWLEDLFNL